jgi:protein TonB
MNLFSFHKDNLDEVVFENRNKQYGAYVLRKSYDGNLLKASASSFGVLLLFGGVAYLASMIHTEVPKMIEPLHTTQVNTLARKIEFILDPPEDAAPAARGTSNQGYQIVRDNQVQTTTTTTQNPNVTGSPDGVEGGTATTTVSGSGTAIVPMVTEVPPAEPEFLMIVEDMPSFIGGEEAMVRYLSNHINYPPQARESGIEGKVMVSFVVQTDGSIDKLSLVKSIGFGCDEEAMRVIASMPKWNAGKQNGKLRAVKLVLPIYFRLQ